MNRSEFQLIAPPHSPFGSDGGLSLDIVDQQARHFVDTGVNGAFVAGSTGEFASLAVEEREQLAERWISAGTRFGLRIIVHVGHNCQSDSIRLARHAEANGADSIACIAPSYFKPTRIEPLVDFLAPIAAAAPSIPFYYYDIPGMTGIDFPIVDVLERATEKIDNLAGVKHTTDDLRQLPRLLDEFGDSLDILFGCDELLLPAIGLGVRGGIGSTYNWAAPLYREMLAMVDKGDLDSARALQLKSLRMIEMLSSFGYLAASKSLMKLTGIDCGPVRPPLANLKESQIEALQAQSKLIDILGFANR